MRDCVEQTDIAMTSRDDHYYKNRRLLAFIGLWPYQKASKRAIRVRFVYLVMVTATLIQLCLIFMSASNMGHVIEYLQMFLPVLCFTCCYFNLIRNFATVKQIFDRIKSDWIALNDQRKILIMQKYSRENGLCTLGIAVCFYLYVIFLMTPSLIRVLLNVTGIIEDVQLTLPIRLPPWMVGIANYYITLSGQYFYMIFTCTVGIAHYSMYMSFIQHTYALCSIVTIMLDPPFKENSCHIWRAQSNDTHLEEYYWIVSAVKYYNNVTSFVDLINVIYSKTYLVEVSVGMIYVIMDYLYLFELIDEAADMNKILTNCACTGSSLILVYVLCFLGQRLIDHNDIIVMKCCQIPFYALSIKTQKTLQLLILRTLRPFGLSMRGMMVSSNELFANIMRTSFSFATVFYNMR